MQKIISHLWFHDHAEEAVVLYTSLFKDARQGSIARYGPETAAVSGQTEGSVMSIDFELAGHKFIALNGGPIFDFTPAISFSINCETAAEIDKLWTKLTPGGKVLMPLDKYPFSERYGWLNDRYGVSWQLNLSPWRQKVVPSLMFTGPQHMKAEEAMKYYTGLFKDSGIEAINRYGKGSDEPPEAVSHAVFKLAGQDFIAMDSGYEHGFNFTPAVSFLVNCESQREVDDLWQKLTKGGEAGQCGWLTDRYGLSWQVVPTALDDLLRKADPDRAGRVTAALLKMRKIEIEPLQKAYEGK